VGVGWLDIYDLMSLDDESNNDVYGCWLCLALIRSQGRTGTM
jgi:hypothetical protein